MSVAIAIPKEPSRKAKVLKFPARNCTVCENPIPAKRLQAVPNATKCVVCLEAEGDVPRVRRYDEHNMHGEQVCQTYFTDNPHCANQVRRVNELDFPTQALEVAADPDIILRDEEAQFEHAFAVANGLGDAEKIVTTLDLEEIDT